MKKTIVQMLNLSKEKYGSKPYLFEKDSSGWSPTTFEKAYEESHYIASGLIELGLESEDKGFMLDFLKESSFTLLTIEMEQQEH